VLAVQEVEDIEALKDFVRFHLVALYPNIALIEGNDTRFIDVGLVRVPDRRSHVTQHETHPAAPSERVFARDLLEVEILDSKREPPAPDPVRQPPDQPVHRAGGVGPGGGRPAQGRPPPPSGGEGSGGRRGLMRPDSRFVVLGDMNDVPEADTLSPLTTSQTST
jgi:hypothetical protein